MTIDLDFVNPELLRATLESLAPLEVEYAGQTFPAVGCVACSESDVVFRTTEGAVSVPRDAVVRIKAVR